MSLCTKPSPPTTPRVQRSVSTTRNKPNPNNIHLPYTTPNQTPPIQTPPPRPNKTTFTNPIKPKTHTTTSSDVLKLMDSLNLPIPPDTYVSLIEECTLSRDPAKASELHSHLANASLEPTLPLLNRLILMFVSCGDLGSARKVFDEMPLRRDSSSWGILILGHLEMGLFEEGISLFVDSGDVFFEGSVLSTWVLSSVIRASDWINDLGLGMQVHGVLMKLGAGCDPSVGVSLIGFYRKFGFLKDADFLFDHLSSSTFAWTAKIENRFREGRFVEAIKAFNEMGREGVRRNSFTLSSALKACTRLDEDGYGDDDRVKCGHQLHANAIKLGLESVGFVECGLVDMYGKCGVVGDARRVFEMATNKRNVACWNAMVMGLLKNGFHVESLKVLYQMKACKMEIQQSLMDKVRIACGDAVCFT